MPASRTGESFLDVKIKKADIDVMDIKKTILYPIYSFVSITKNLY